MKKIIDLNSGTSKTNFRYSRFIAMLAFFFFYITSSEIFSKELEVCKEKCKFRSIQAAIDSANPGDTIRIRKGIYQEGMISISKPLILEGTAGVVLDGKKKTCIGYSIKQCGNPST